MKNKILISINPEHVDNIKNGTKRYEYRKIAAKQDVSSIIIYETTPIKQVKRDIVNAHSEIDWPVGDRNADGTYSKKVINNIIESIKATIIVDETDENYAYWNLYRLYLRKTNLNRQKNAAIKALAVKAQAQITKLSDDEIKNLLRRKWITPIMDNILALPTKVIGNFVRELLGIVDKYSYPLSVLDEKIKSTESAVVR